jgi:hypothetical protein
MFLNAQENLDKLMFSWQGKEPDTRCFLKILQTVKHIANSLEPLKEIGLSFEIALAGGSLRDFLTAQEEKIKDLDILVSLNKAPGFEYTLAGESNHIFDSMFPNPEVLTQALNLKSFSYDTFKNTTHADQFYYFLITELLAKSWKITRAYAPRPFSQQAREAFAKQCVRSDYHNQFLRGVVKISDEKLSYPVDVLLCNTTSADYVSSFDFEICKAFMVFDSLSEIESLLLKVTEQNVESNIIVHKIMFSQGFLSDIEHKRLTLNAEFFDMDAVEHALMGHYPRIQEKFIEYCFYFNPEQNLMDKKVRDYIEEFEKFCALHQHLPSYEDSYDFKFRALTKK